MKYVRKNILEIKGYVPGEQPHTDDVIKLNTNENPYPPAPEIIAYLQNFDISLLKLYPNPTCEKLKKTIAEALNQEIRQKNRSHSENTPEFGITEGNILIGNGSDDILTITVRTFLDEGDTAAFCNPSYSLYPTLIKIQNAIPLQIELTDNFDLPDSLHSQIKHAKLIFICNPNAPTGNIFSKEKIAEVCSDFDGMVFIDEAYVDFAKTNCLDLLEKFDNVIVSRTLSKSYSLAGIRIGFAVACKNIIEQMHKVKDSYNVNRLSQEIAEIAIKNKDYFQTIRAKVIHSRQRLYKELMNMGFTVIPSQTNFIFASPPDKAGQKYFEFLRKENIFVRYFPYKRTKEFVRISIGTEEEIDTLIKVTRKIY